MIQKKTEQDIAVMRESNQIVSDVHRLLTPHVRPGARVSELDAMAEDFIRANGAKPAFKGYSSGSKSIPPFPATLCVSIDDEVVHGIPTDRVLEEGQIVSIDVGTEKNGFFGDGAMTLPVGTVDGEKLRLMRVTKESLYRGIEKAVPGNHLHDVSAAIQEHVEDNGFSVVRDLVGHGIGKSLHEEQPVPNFGRAGTGPRLEAGVTIAIEPMVNYGSFKVRIAANGWTVLTRDASPSAHFEHTVYISKDGPVLLTNHFERENG
ncbi:MAG: type I methionyl aminopeptidase [Ignavibacteria bacterium]|nr:MAG: type I methionyl aminopeptidase [Ignavibacteria bacterium]